jgi:hypothetical protein
MTEDNKRALLSALKTIQNLTIQNLSLQDILTKFSSDWKEQSDQMQLDPAFAAPVRAVFAQALQRLEQVPGDSLDARQVQELLRQAATQGKPN